MLTGFIAFSLNVGCPQQKMTEFTNPVLHDALTQQAVILGFCSTGGYNPPRKDQPLRSLQVEDMVTQLMTEMHATA